MGEVYEAVAACERPVHLVYVLTDLAGTAWNAERPAEGLDKVAKIKSGKGAKMATFVMRLAPEQIQNVSVESAELPQSATIQGESVEIRSRIRSKGPATTRMVEFYVDGLKKGEKPVRSTQFPGRCQLPHARRCSRQVNSSRQIVLKGTPVP